ncbi:MULTISPECIES: conjugal transfer protein MobA [Flavobacterium]|uniref:Conjugal transfer protein MobA n=1 Tax=Flavobacterium xylosi TaxID=3230415 RepID=A0ABW6HWQ7_9FLAO|nr:conjugal transfer protein MobA [Flavobacterium yafengii]MDI6046902.1 conjugal transfer protein MobA [Flavobacterium yafengii]|tara:strand:+ start:171 stop:602 length:432 start_codon:yes stop_codon:yes gene_type:complete
MESNGKTTPHKGGRHPKKDPAVHRYSISLSAEENARFLSLYEASRMDVMAHFITACIFQKAITNVTVDKATMDYYMRLTTLFGQFRAVGTNYNQVVKILYRNFSEKKAAAYLYKLEKQTAEMAVLCQKIILLTQEFEAKYLKK